MSEQLQNLSAIKSGLSISGQIHDYLLQRIVGGQFASGQRLPSEQDLAKTLRVSRASLREALQLLDLEGYINRKQGIGTFIIGAHPPRTDAGLEQLYSVTEIIASRGMQPGTSDIEIFSELASEEIALALRLDPGEAVTVVNRVRTADGLPFCWDTSRFPTRFLPPTTDPETIGNSLFKFSMTNLGLQISHAVTRLIPTPCNYVLSERLRIPIGTLMMIFNQVHYLSDGTPIWHANVHFLAKSLTWQIVRTRV